MLLLNSKQQIGSILVAVGCCFLQIFQPLFLVHTNTVSEIVNSPQLIFRKRIAILCRLPEVEDGFFDVLPAFFLEVDLAGNIGGKGDAVLCQFLQKRQTSGDILWHQLALTQQLPQLVLGKGIAFRCGFFQIFHRFGWIVVMEFWLQIQLA